MSRYALEHLSDPTLLRGLAALVARDRVTTADLLAHIAEVDARGLYRDQNCPSMFAYCVEKLRLSEDAAHKRIQAARAARRFPAIFHALARGRLHLTGVGLLAAHLTEENAQGLLAAARDRSKAEIEQLLAERFPRPGLLAWVASLPGAPGDGVSGPLAPAQVGMTKAGHAPGHAADRLVAGQVGQAGAMVSVQLAPAHVGVPLAPAPVERSRVQPLAPQTYAVQFTLSQSGYDLLRRAQELLGHQIPSGEIGQVFERSLGLLVRELEKTKFAATSKPRTSAPRPTRSARHIPAHVKRAVWERDGGRCTFVGESGTRCLARTRLEFDHIEEVARGGEATVSGIRLLCRAHNQLLAEHTFGAEFMRRTRAAARARAIATHATTEVGAHDPKTTRADGGFAEAGAHDSTTTRADGERAEAAAQVECVTPERAAPRCATSQLAASGMAGPHRAADERARELDVVPWLRALGFSAAQARRAAELCGDLPDATLEERVKAALSHCRPRGIRVVRPGGSPGVAASCAGSVPAGAPRAPGGLRANGKDHGDDQRPGSLSACARRPRTPDEPNSGPTTAARPPMDAATPTG